ncbi:MAG: hypothetical protein WC365_10040 [Candidatus Babeliales bacterium]|jgi:hypothetical protein
MALSHRKHVEPHRHTANEIVGNYVSLAKTGSSSSTFPSFIDYFTITKKLTMKDPADVDGDFIELNVVMLEDPAFPGIYNPFLEISEGILCHKDVMSYGGFIGTASAPGVTGGGCVQIADRFEHMSDPSRINLTGASSYVAITKGSTIAGESWDLDAVLSGLRCAEITAKGHILPIGASKDLGSTTYPWNDVISLYAHIGNVTISNNLYVNAINTITAADLPVNLNAGYKMVVNGDLQVTGSIIGTSSGIKCGSSSTNASGVATVSFASAFGTTPSITCTVVDASSRHISIVITAQNSAGFSVKTTLVSSHSHNVGGTAAADGSHDHDVQGDTDYQDVAHGHGFSGTISDESSHTHAFGTLGSGQYAATPDYLYFHNLGLGGQTCGLTVATASYGPHASLNTGGGSSHSHGYSFTVGQSTASHKHDLATVSTSTDGSHTHTVSGSTDSAAPTNISIAFNWIATV